MATPPVFSYDKKFQIQILALMFRDYDFLTLAQDILNPSYFSDKILGWYFTAFRDYYQDYQMQMDSEAVRNELKKAVSAKRIKQQEVQTYVETFKKIESATSNKKYVTDEVITFSRHQAIKQAALEMPQLLQQNDFPAIETLWRQALSVGTVGFDLGIEYFTSYPQRIAERAAREEELTIPTGITSLDVVIGGGLHPGQLALWMAPTNKGKSVGLVHCGKRAVVEGRKVVYYTLELGGDDVSTRYDSSFTKIDVNQLNDNIYDVAKILEDIGKKFGNNLIIKSYPTKSASVDTLRSHLNRCAASGFVPDLVIVDYLDLLKPTTKRKEKREELSDITEDLRGLAGELNVPIWSATQSRRAAVAKDVHGEDDVAEDWGKMQIADIVITINQNSSEAINCDRTYPITDENGNVIDEVSYFGAYIRLLVAKNRNGPRWRTVGLGVDFNRMCFFVPSTDKILEEKEKEDQKKITKQNKQKGKITTSPTTTAPARRPPSAKPRT